MMFLPAGFEESEGRVVLISSYLLLLHVYMGICRRSRPQAIKSRSVRLLPLAGGHTFRKPVQPQTPGAPCPCFWDMGYTTPRPSGLLLFIQSGLAVPRLSVTNRRSLGFTARKASSSLASPFRCTNQTHILKRQRM